MIHTDVKHAKSPKEFPVQVRIPVAWGDMDAFNHVNNVVYFKWFESARIAYFEHTESMGVMRAEGIGPILASTSCRYRAPAELSGYHHAPALASARLAATAL